MPGTITALTTAFELFIAWIMFSPLSLHPRIHRLFIRTEHQPIRDANA